MSNFKQELRALSYLSKIGLCSINSLGWIFSDVYMYSSQGRFKSTTTVARIDWDSSEVRYFNDPKEWI